LDIFSGPAPEYQYLVIDIRNGEFLPFENLDNRPVYQSQRTYILGSGVIYFNTAAYSNSIIIGAWSLPIIVAFGG